MMHNVSGQNFHGPYSLKLRGPANGFVLSGPQGYRYQQALCGVAECKCGGGYGEGPDRDSARVFAPIDGSDLSEHPYLRAAWELAYRDHVQGGRPLFPLVLLPA